MIVKQNESTNINNNNNNNNKDNNNNNNSNKNGDLSEEQHEKKLICTRNWTGKNA